MNKLLELLIQISHGIASHFGDSCEIVIHDLNEKQPDSSIVHIKNGHSGTVPPTSYWKPCSIGMRI